MSEGVMGGTSGYEHLGPRNQDINTQTGGSSETSLTFDEEAKKALDTALTSTEYSKTAAIGDAKAAADYAMTQVLQAGIPQVSGAAKGAGGYNASTAEMLTGDTAARATAAGSQVILDTISKYSAAQSAGITARTGAVAATTGRKVTTAEDKAQQERSAGALWDSLHPGQVAGGRYSGGQQGNTVICTQMYMDGHLTRTEYVNDNRYVRNHFSYYTVNGYQFWAVPFVRLMRRNNVAYAVGKFIGVRWSKHCAAHYMPTLSRNVTGWAMTTFVAPICWLIGVFAPESDFKKLWEESPYHGK
jgi:hypothetical protein